jgi:hypothetical protein
MNSYKRNGRKWTVNECLQLQREYELLQLSIDEIASRHERTPNSIMFKLDAEGFADYNKIYPSYHNLVSTGTNSNEDFQHKLSIIDDCKPFDNIAEQILNRHENDMLKQQVITLEKQMKDLQQMMKSMTKSKTTNKSSLLFA